MARFTRHEIRKMGLVPITSRAGNIVSVRVPGGSGEYHSLEQIGRWPEFSDGSFKVVVAGDDSVLFWATRHLKPPEWTTALDLAELVDSMAAKVIYAKDRPIDDPLRNDDPYFADI